MLVAEMFSNKRIRKKKNWVSLKQRTFQKVPLKALGALFVVHDSAELFYFSAFVFINHSSSETQSQDSIIFIKGNFDTANDPCPIDI